MLFPRHYERDVLTVDFFPEKIPFPSSPPTLSQTVNRDMLHLLTTSAPSTPLPTRAFGPPILNADEKLLISFNDTSSSASSGGAGFLSSFPSEGARHYYRRSASPGLPATLQLYATPSSSLQKLPSKVQHQPCVFLIATLVLVSARPSACSLHNRCSMIWSKVNVCRGRPEYRRSSQVVWSDIWTASLANE
jgi:hypothetical protein